MVSLISLLCINSKTFFVRASTGSYMQLYFSTALV